MMIDLQSQFDTARIYHDFNSLAKLKAQGKDDNPEALREAAKQFEAIFMGMMLKSMRDANAAIIDEPFLDSAQLGMYQQMYDEQLSLHLGSTSALGLTDILVEQLGGNRSSELENKKNIQDYNPSLVIASAKKSKTANNNLNNEMLRTLQQAKISTIMPAVSMKSGKNLDSPVVSPLQVVENQRGEFQAKSTTAELQLANSVQEKKERGLDFTSPSAFVKSLWPYAQQAAKLLQLDPKLLIAQAALESGEG